MSYSLYLQDLAPTWWLKTFTGRRWLEGHGLTLDRLMTRAGTAVSLRFISGAPVDALALLGGERMLSPFPTETPNQFRARVQGAWEYWRWSGTVEGIRLALEQVGWTARVYEHFITEPGSHEFSVRAMPADVVPNPAKWNGGSKWNDGKKWNFEIKSLPFSELEAIINKVKAAHSKLRELRLVYKLPSRWNDGSKWNDGSVYSDSI